VKSEAAAPVPQPRKGDKRKLDFVVLGNGSDFAIEVKWAKKRTIGVEEDMLKLSAYQKKASGRRAFLCVFGLERFVANIRFSASADPALAGVSPKEVGTAVTAAFGQTTYCCRIYEVT
jgi:Holliday junction resolvase